MERKLYIRLANTQNPYSDSRWRQKLSRVTSKYHYFDHIRTKLGKNGFFVTFCNSPSLPTLGSIWYKIDSYIKSKHENASIRRKVHLDTTSRSYRRAAACIHLAEGTAFSRRRPRISPRRENRANGVGGWLRSKCRLRIASLSPRRFLTLQCDARPNAGRTDATLVPVWS